MQENKYIYRMFWFAFDKWLDTKMWFLIISLSGCRCCHRGECQPLGEKPIRESQLALVMCLLVESFTPLATKMSATDYTGLPWGASLPSAFLIWYVWCSRSLTRMCEVQHSTISFHLLKFIYTNVSTNISNALIHFMWMCAIIIIFPPVRVHLYKHEHNKISQCSSWHVL
jgi:hypothetical protein